MLTLSKKTDLTASCQHHNESGATKTGLYSVLDKVIKTSSRVAIAISEKI